MPVIKLTQESISKLRCPDDKRSVQVCDAQHRGLLLELRSTVVAGAKPRLFAAARK